MSNRTGFLRRSFVTPVVTASFVIVAFTGVLMLLHVKSSMIKEFHEWISVLFVAAAGVHLALNWGAFVSYLRRPITIALGVVVAAMIVMMLAGVPNASRGGRPPFMEIARRVEAVSLAQASSLFGVDAERSLALLRIQGLRVESEDDRIGDIARNNGKRSEEILDLLMASGEGRQDH